MTCPNGLNKTILVSYPRSGHHLLVRGLTEAANHRIVYSEQYNSAHNMTNCDYVNLEKSHDFDLTDPIDPGLNYIVLIRDFLPATTSWHKAIRSDLPLEEFIDSKRDYYDGFVKKWSVLNPFRYESFVRLKWGYLVIAAHSMGFMPDLDKLDRWVRMESANF